VRQISDDIQLVQQCSIPVQQQLIVKDIYRRDIVEVKPLKNLHLMINCKEFSNCSFVFTEIVTLCVEIVSYFSFSNCKIVESPFQKQNEEKHQQI